MAYSYAENNLLTILRLNAETDLLLSWLAETDPDRGRRLRSDWTDPACDTSRLSHVDGPVQSWRGLAPCAATHAANHPECVAAGAASAIVTKS